MGMNVCPWQRFVHSCCLSSVTLMVSEVLRYFGEINPCLILGEEVEVMKGYKHPDGHHDNRHGSCGKATSHWD